MTPAELASLVTTIHMPLSVPRRDLRGRRLEYDHVHKHARDNGVPYEFSDAGQLLTDFFEEVDKVLKEVL